MSALPRGKRILSGIQPTGELHLGNWIGAWRTCIALQEHNQVTLFLADWHSLNSVRDAAERRRLAHELTLDLIALGVDPERTTFYRQSDLLEAAELEWILASVTPLGLLERCHAYKDAIANQRKPDLGLFAYPVLQAADILIHDADLVPVGQDQKQHIEVTRDIAIKFNETYGETFRLPDAFIDDKVAVVPGIDGEKMSKSHGNVISLFAPEKKLRKQVMRIVTDSTPVEEPKDPEKSVVYQLYAQVADACERAALAERFRAGGMGYGDAKRQLADKLLEVLGPYRERKAELAARPDYAEDVLADGAARARESIAPLMERVRAAAGLGPARAR